MQGFAAVWKPEGLASRLTVSALRVLLSLLIASCFLWFIFVSFVVLTAWWGRGPFPWDYELEAPALTTPYYAIRDRYKDLGAQVYDINGGSTNANFIGLLGSTMIAAVATIALRSLPTQTASGQDQLRGFNGVVRRVWLQVKRVLFYQVPPRRFWFWWCGGMHLVDAFIVLGVCGICILWMYDLVIQGYKYLQDSINNGKFEDYYEGQSVNEAKLEINALRSGFMINAATLYMFYPVPRNSFLQALFRVDFTYLIKYHRWLGHLVMITTTIHGILYYVLWGIEGHFRKEFRTWQMHSISNLAGNLSYIFGIILWVTSIEYVRRRYFEIFYNLHIVGALGFYVFGFMHYDGFWYYSAPGLILYFLDLTYRLAQWMNVSIVTGSLLSEEVLALHLQFTPETKLDPNSFIFIMSPDASRSQWHPFTLSYVRNSTSPNEPAHATIYLKPYGKWVKSIVRRITSKGSALVKIDGPYGGASTLLQGSCDAAVIFAGGIGVTPMLGLLAALRDRYSAAQFHGAVTSPSLPQKVVFVWACRNPEEFELLDEQLVAEARQENSWLEIHLHCTGAGYSKPFDAPSPKLDAATDGKGSDSDSNKEGVEGVLSLEPIVKANQEKFPQLDRPELKLASPFFLKPSLLQGYGIGYPMWAFMHILAFFGAYFAVLPAQSFWLIQYMTRQDGIIYWLIVTVEMMCMTIGAMGLPALFIFPIFMWRRYKSQKAMQQADSPANKQEGSIVSNFKDAAMGRAEGGSNLTYSKGRPDIRSTLKWIQAEYSHLSEIHVHAAGPPGMVRDCKYHATDLNNFIKAGPQLVYEIDSFSL